MSGHAPTPKVPRAVQWLIAITPPVFWSMEWALRELVFPPEFQELRQLLAPSLRWPAWCFCVATVVVALALLPVARRKLEASRAPSLNDTNALVGVYFLWTSLLQAPALGCTLLCLFGGPTWPTAIAVAVSTAAVFALGR